MIEVNGQYITADVADIIQELKTQLYLNGKNLFYKSIQTRDNYMICCPFHKDGQERKPSMGIHEKTGVCHCFSCGWVGSIQELVSNCFGYDDLGVYGSKWLIKNFLTLQVEERKDVELDFYRTSYPSNASITNRNGSSTNNDVDSVSSSFVSEQELDSYRYYHSYWTKRGIIDPYIIELFDLGYDEKTDCITMPVRDKNGNCLFVARRSVKTKWFNYPEGVEKPLYGIYELSKCSEISDIIVCESMIDALTCWQYGKFAVAMNGLGSEYQFKQLRELPCRKLILATDNDEAGMRARQRIAKNVTNKILTQYIIPEGKKDINDLSIDEFKNMKEIFI